MTTDTSNKPPSCNLSCNCCGEEFEWDLADNSHDALEQRKLEAEDAGWLFCHGMAFCPACEEEVFGQEDAR